MKVKLFSTIIFLIIFISVHAQKQYIIGNISNEFGDHLPDSQIFNVRTEELVTSDKNGNYIISAKNFDELRFIRPGYERFSVKISEDEFKNPLNIKLIKLVVDLEEVKIAFHPTGDLKKDMSYFRTSEKSIELNDKMRSYARTPMTEVVPQNNIPSAFSAPNYKASQLDLLKVGNALGELFRKSSNPKTKPNHAEIQDFYRRVKDAIDLDYFKKYGLNDYNFDVFLAYADERFELAKNYRKNFNKAAIENQLKLALNDFLKTHKIES